MKPTRLIPILALALLAGCGGPAHDDDSFPTPVPTPASGSLHVTWSFQGAEAPSHTRLMLIDQTLGAQTCATLPFQPALGIVIDHPGLPTQGTTIFPNVTAGARWMVVAFGTRADGTRVAEACHDQVNVLAGQMTVVDLPMVNWVADTAGVWDVEQRMNIGLPLPAQAALLAIQAACPLLHDAQLCTIVTQVTGVLTDLDVVSEWTVDRAPDGSFHGTVRWMSVEGLDVTAVNPVIGTFDASVPGSTGVVFDRFEARLGFGNLLLFVVERVLHYDLNAWGPAGAAFVQSLADQYVSPMSFHGGGTLWDSDFDGINDRLDGSLTGHVEVAGWHHDFSAAYAGTRPD
jgi:hypothetical protein